MSELILQFPVSPSPRWFTVDAALSVVHEGLVSADGDVVAHGDKLLLISGSVPSPGTVMIIRRTRTGLVAESKEAHDLRVSTEKSDRDARRAAFEEENRLSHERSMRKLEEEAADRNAALNIPVRWTSGQKHVLSGLSETSSGTGDNARTVTHVLLLEPINDGRFRRPDNGFLCTSASGSNGERWLGRLSTWSYGLQGHYYVSQVTCSQCLKLAKRWKDSSRRVAPELVAD